MSGEENGKQLQYAARYLAEATELIRLQEELLALLRARGIDAEVAENVLDSLRTAAAIMADHKNELEAETSAVRHGLRLATGYPSIRGAELTLQALLSRYITRLSRAEEKLHL